MNIGKYSFDLSHQALIMGILNVTPDSFSDGGKWNDTARAIDRTAQMIEEGADMIDIGAESTRPGHTQISVEEELERMVPVLKALRSRFDIPLSVDCYRHETAQAAIAEGANLINDIWGLQYDKKMASLIADSEVSLCLMHNRDNVDYKHFPADIVSDLSDQLTLASEANIAPEKIIIDPGIGFAKNREQDVALLRQLDLLTIFDLPILIGTSRKRVIGNILDVPPRERDLGTAVTSVYGFLKGARLFRVHNVSANRQALDMAIALEGRKDGLH